MKITLFSEHLFLHQQIDSEHVVLGLVHMQGAFYILVLGCSAAAVVYLVEILGHH